MARASQKLDELAALLERTGGDPKRLEAVRRAQNFRRSWLDLAKILADVRKKRRFERWGYTDFYLYCKEELTLKKGTVDKLTMSFRTLERHAPEVLNWDGVAKTIPSYEAIDYYAKVVGPAANDERDEGGESEHNPPARLPNNNRRATPERVDALSAAVFDEGQPVAELRKQFDNVFFPKPKGSEKLGVLNKANAAARKLAEILPDIDGLPDAQVQKLEAQLGKLRIQLDELAAPLKEQVAAARAKTRKANKPRVAAKKPPKVQKAAGE